MALPEVEWAVLLVSVIVEEMNAGLISDFTPDGVFDLLREIRERLGLMVAHFDGYVVRP